MNHPFEQLSARIRGTFFWISLFFTLFVMLVMNMVGAGLTNDQAPLGIVSFEFAGTLQKFDAMMASWDHATLLRLSFSLGLDFLFLVLYAVSISLACLWAGEVLRNMGWMRFSLGVWGAWGVWLAAALDVIENFALTSLVFGGRLAWLPPLARWAAILKFSLVFIALVIAFLGLVIHLLRKIKFSS